ncbi:MAG: pentapeptide repeat-containing protein [Eubacteriales bacterium]|nr:pentapeptide repeat-containing protein [Eubacteriales bacterium]
MSELTGSHRIAAGLDLRGRSYEGGQMSFCSVLDSGLSGTEVRGGRLTGNGWIHCNFCCGSYSGMLLEMERFDRCAVGNVRLTRVEAIELRASECSFAGDRWSGCTFEKGKFRKCTFSHISMEDVLFVGTVFEDCTFLDTSMKNVRFRKVKFKNCRFGAQPGELCERCRFVRCEILG